MPVLSTTRDAFAAFLCAALSAACAQSSSVPGFGAETQGNDSGVAPAAAADGGSSSEDASVDGTSSSSDTDASGSPHGSPDAGGPGSVPTPDAGTGSSTTGADGGPCTVNLGCVLAAPPSTGDIRQDCVNRVNQFRTTCACMKPLARWTAGEACADMDAQYDAMMMVGHAGAMANICNWGEAQDECPGDPSDQYVIDSCLQQMWSEGPPPAGTTIAECESPQMLESCYEMHGHFINMTNPDVNQIACGFYTTSTGAVWAAQNLSP